MSTASSAPTEGARILRMPEVERITGLPRVSIYRLTRTGHFPRSIKIGMRAVGWRDADIAAWLVSRADAP